MICKLLARFRSLRNFWNTEMTHSFWNHTSLLVLFLAAGGCRPAVESGPPNMMPHLLGALQIQDVKERDVALKMACREAAEEGSGPTVLMGIPHIEDSALRDQVAEECAIALGDTGESEAALEVARLIADESKRNQLLARLGAE